MQRRKKLQNSSEKNGFTLAEVLITLVIIGVIGALTVPALIQNTQKQEYVSALKKAYSTLSQASQMIISEEGSPKGDDSWMTDVDALYNMYKKYLNNAKDCGADSGCAPEMHYKFLDGVTVDTEPQHSGGMYRKLVLSDGALIMFSSFAVNKTCPYSSGHWSSGSNDWCAGIFADINGIKKPNIWGRDMFLFVLKENGLYPAGCDTSTICTPRKGAWTKNCACRVLREGAMNY